MNDLTGAEWTALVIQGVAALAAAAAAVFAWLTAQSLKKQSEENYRVRASEHLQTLQRLLTEYVHQVGEQEDSFRAQMNFRAELGVTYVPLPRCVALVDPRGGEPTKTDDFHREAAAAMAEIEAAQAKVWSGHADPLPR